MSLPVIILGAGGHAKVVIDALLLAGVEIVGIVDKDPAKRGAAILGIPVIGEDDAVLRHRPDTISLVNGVGSVRQPDSRKRLFDTFKAKGFSFAIVRHPSAVIASDVLLAEGVQVMAGAVIQPGSRIGADTIVNTNASIDHDCSIADHVHVAPGATLSGNVMVENGAHIGAGATVLQGIRIGRNSIIGAGSVVLRDVPDGVTIYGVPGKAVTK